MENEVQEGFCNICYREISECGKLLKCAYCKKELHFLYFRVHWIQKTIEGKENHFVNYFCFHQCMIKYYLENSHSSNEMAIREYLKNKRVKKNEVEEKLNEGEIEE